MAFSLFFEKISKQLGFIGGREKHRVYKESHDIVM